MGQGRWQVKVEVVWVEDGWGLVAIGLKAPTVFFCPTTLPLICSGHANCSNDDGHILSNDQIVAELKSSSTSS